VLTTVVGATMVEVSVTVKPTSVMMVEAPRVVVTVRV
jgi:hypothetical protein